MPTKPETLKGPDLKTWDDVDDLIEASTTGWNPLQKLPLLLEKYIPWAKDFTFGFFIESDLPEVKSYGWVHVKPDQIAGENWNENAGLRFGLDISGGVVKFRDNYLLCMPKDHRKKQMDRRHKEHEDMVTILSLKQFSGNSSAECSSGSSKRWRSTIINIKSWIPSPMDCSMMTIRSWE